MTGPRAIPFWSDAEVDAGLASALAQLHARAVLAYPTETLYGFGGAVDHESVQALITLKGRPKGKPFLLLISGGRMLERLDLRMNTAAARLAAKHWPGPLTLVLPGGERRVPDELRGPEGGIAVRWTPHPGLTRLITAYGDPITSTSANRPGSPPALSAPEIIAQWSEAINRGTLLVLDGGALRTSQPSTVVDCTGEQPRVIRPGAVPVETLRESVPTLLDKE